MDVEIIQVASDYGCPCHHQPQAYDSNQLLGWLSRLSARNEINEFNLNEILSGDTRSKKISNALIQATRMAVP